MQVLRTAAHNILYTVANSNSMNVEITGYAMETWLTALLIADGVIAAALIAWGISVFRKKKEKAA